MLFIVVNGKMGLKMDLEDKSSMMISNIQEIGGMEKRMDMEKLKYLNASIFKVISLKV